MGRSRRKHTPQPAQALPAPTPVGRRQFLKAGLTAAGGLLLAACSPAALPATSIPANTQAPANTAVPANTQAPANTVAPPAPTATAVPQGELVPELIVSQLAF